MIDVFPDVSHYEPVDFNKFKGKLLITKCTEGVSYIDPTFIHVKDSCNRLGIRFGAYHFFRCDKPVSIQMEHYLKTLGSTDLPPILDIETRDGASVESIRTSVGLFLRCVEKVTGRIPMLYSGQSFLQELSLPAEFARYPLWLAKYSIVEPPAPKPWDKITYWQYSEEVPFDGIGKCDGNKIISASALL
jgi:lysozyme